MVRLVQTALLVGGSAIMTLASCSDSQRNPVEPVAGRLTAVGRWQSQVDETKELELTCPDGFVGGLVKEGNPVDRNANGFICTKNVPGRGNTGVGFVVIDDIPGTGGGGGCHGGFVLEDVDPLHLGDVLADRNLDRKKCKKVKVDDQVDQIEYLEDNVD